MTNVIDAREQAPVLLDKLYDVNHRAAEFIADVYSEVFAQLRRGEVKDETMVDWLMEALAYHLTPED